MEHNKYNQDYVDGLSGPNTWFTKFCSTFGIVNAALGAGSASGYWDGQPSYRTQFADNALDAAATFVGCTAAFSTGFQVRNVRAYIWMKNYIRNSATFGTEYRGMFFQLQVATGTAAFNAMSANTGTPIIDCRFAGRATSALMLVGVVPDNQNIAAARICVYPERSIGGAAALTDTASFDCNIDAAP